MENTESRETDAAIAVNVFGWKWMRRRDAGLCALVPPTESEHERVNWHAPSWEIADAWPGLDERFTDWNRMGMRRDGPQTVSFLPRYTSDIGEAWRIVVAMREKPSSARFAFTDYLHAVIDARIPLSAGRIRGNDLILYMTPQDICEAALKTTKGAPSLALAGGPKR